MRKAELRKLYLNKRLALSEVQYEQLNYQLCENFFAHVNLSFVNVLHIFIPIESKREVNTWLIIDRIRREFPNVRVSIPKINNGTLEMENFFFEGLHQLKKNTWGILEPKNGLPTPIESIDTVLVPLLTFDSNGQRVGYGKGFYDKLLSKCSATSQRIGLSFFPPVTAIDDIDEHDQPLTAVVTPTETFTF